MAPAAMNMLEVAEVNAIALARKWWVPVIRGAVAILFGILTFGSPARGLLALIYLFGAYAIVEGALNLVAGVKDKHHGRPWGSLFVEGLLSIGAGVVVFVWPGISALVLLFLIGAWALIRGVMEIASAIRLRKQIQGEWLLGLSGVLSIAFGVLCFMFPGAGALAVAFWIAAYAIIFGALLIGLGLRLRSWERSAERQIPSGGVPTPA